MRMLAIDTSRGACSAAVYDGALRYALARESEPMSRGHAEALAPMVERVLKATDGGVASLTKIAVAVGPGSFTGMRIGLAMARAMALALGIPVVGVSTLVAYCGPMLDDPKPGVIASVIDAGHGHVYFQLIDSKAKQIFSPRVDLAARRGARDRRQPGADRRRRRRPAGRGGAARRRRGRRQRGARAYPDIVAARPHRPGRRSRAMAGAPALYQAARRASRARRRRSRASSRDRDDLLLAPVRRPRRCGRLRAETAADCARIHAAGFAYPWARRSWRA